MRLDKGQQKYLIQLARHEVIRCIAGSCDSRSPEKQETELPSSTGAFVSLYIAGELRGCIGTFEEADSLESSVCRMARAAAMSDTRFPPLERAELEDLKIELSILGPRMPIQGPEDIEIGRHGIFILSGSSRGTFLPQVAVKQGWDAREFIGHCSKHKAGIGWEGWKEAELYAYEAFVFSS